MNADSASLSQDDGHRSSELSGSLEQSQHDRSSPLSSEHSSLLSLGGSPSPLSLGGDGHPSPSSLGDTLSPLSLCGDGHPSPSDNPSPLSLGGDGHPSSSPSRTPSPLSLGGDEHPSPSSTSDTPLCGDELPSFEQVLEDKELFEPLYDGADITICGAYCQLYYAVQFI